MNILNIWEIGGDSCLIAKILRRRGHNFEILKREGYDPFGIMEYYGEKALPLSGYEFLKLCVKRTKYFDVIHVHDIIKIIPQLRKKYPKKKIILHYHGSKLRSTPSSERAEAEKSADAILVSMKDLLVHNFAKEAHYAYNPIDTELFSRKKTPKDDRALIILKLGNTRSQIENVLQKNGLKISFEDRSRADTPLKYNQMPSLLSRYTTYLDLYLQDSKLGDGISNTALQAMSMGLNVLTHELKFVNTLPEENIPKNVANFMEKLYSS